MFYVHLCVSFTIDERVYVLALKQEKGKNTPIL